MPTNVLLLSLISLATKDPGLSPPNSRGIQYWGRGTLDSLKFFKISCYSQQENSKECRMWVMRGADGPLRYHNRKEGLIRGGEEEGSQGQEEEVSVSAVVDAGGTGSRSGAPEDFL